jgi:hypothetical protein
MYVPVACGTIFGKGSSGPVWFHTFFPLRNNRNGQQNNFPILRQPDSHSVLEYCSKLNFLTHNLVCALSSGNSHVGLPLSTIIFFSRHATGMYILGAFGLLDFTMLRPLLAWSTVRNLWTVYLFNFPIFFSGRGKPRILHQRIRGPHCN